MHNLLLILFMSLSTFSMAQDEHRAVYYGEDFFVLEGTEIPDSLKENRYDRLPFSYKQLLRKPVWNLSKSSAGLSIRFRSNSSQIAVKWNILNDNIMNHMAATGIKGVDLYFNNEGTWQYLNTGRPIGMENESTLISNMPQTMREFRIYLPLYDGIKSIEVGIDSNTVIEPGIKMDLKPIIFYGTSITQGGCASRPGMAHTNIISRKLNRECINFGFSGNGKMEELINELIAESDPLLYVVECLPNMTAEEVNNRTIPLVETIRGKRPEAPIVLVENFLYDVMALDKKRNKGIITKNAALKAQYVKLLDSGIKKIHYINTENATGNDHEATVDGVHFTDLGFMRYADFLIEQFAELGLIHGSK